MSSIEGILEDLEDVTAAGELLSGWTLIGFSDPTLTPNGALVTYRQSCLAACLHHRLFFLADLHQDVQRRRSDHPWRDVLLIGQRQRQVGRRKGWFQYRNRDLILFHFGSVIGSLGPVIPILQAVFPITSAAALTAPRKLVSVNDHQAIISSASTCRDCPPYSLPGYEAPSIRLQSSPGLLADDQSPSWQLPTPYDDAPDFRYAYPHAPGRIWP